jgi:hypothetical protein
MSWLEIDGESWYAANGYDREYGQMRRSANGRAITGRPVGNDVFVSISQKVSEQE